MIPEVSILSSIISQTNATTAQKALDEFVKAFEKEGHISTKDLLGGKVVFESEFKTAKYKSYGKNTVLDVVKKSKCPYTLKVHPGPGMTEKIYVVIPDSYISHIKNKECKFTLRVFLFHEFVHVTDRSDIEIAENFALLLLSSKYKVLPKDPKRRKILYGEALRVFVPLGKALQELKANFRMRDFMDKEKGTAARCPISLLDDTYKHLASSMRAVNDQLLGIALEHPKVLEPIRKAVVEYIRKEFNGSSPATRVAVNQVLKRENIPQIQ